MPSKALFCGEIIGRMSRIGRVEGSHVSDILLDTGCSRTMVKSNLVSEDKFLDEAVTMQYAHGDVARINDQP